MNLCVLGAGYVGLTSAVCMAEIGNNVTCVDTVQEKIDNLNKGVMPVFEAGIGEMCRRNMDAGRLAFSTSIEEGVRGSDVVFIAVGTPPAPNGDVDMSQVDAAVDTIVRAINADKIVVNKSTVPVGTQAAMQKRFDAESSYRVEVVSCPEFLQEGTAVKNMMHPDRVVIGSDSGHATEVVSELFKPFGGEQVIVDPQSSELIKYASNAFLATKISYINEIANLCERVGANVEHVAYGMGLDPRIGKQFLRAGIGFGGACFPKDTQGLVSIARQNGCDMKIVQGAIDINTAQQMRCYEKLRDVYPDLRGKTIAVLGLTFKPGTDDVRLAPSIRNVKALLQDGASVRAYDPVGVGNFKREVQGDITYCDSPEQACENADAALLLTEWPQVRSMDLAGAVGAMREKVLVDGRNVFALEDTVLKGVRYYSIGR